MKSAFKMALIGVMAFAAAAVVDTLSAMASAQTVSIVALGASNTAGRGRGAHAGGVNASQAYPAQLQAQLKANGVNARVKNAGVAGDTTAGMMRRMNSAVPRGTNIVILQTGGNDARRGEGGDTSGNVAQMRSALEGRGVKVIMLERILSLVPSGSRDPDGQHFDARGHAAVAAHLLPEVMAAARK
jgi:acyl-CoA thioesterase-1